MSKIFDFLTGGVVGSVERLASEFIETRMEDAQAMALFVKTLDPNGKMRRDLARFASRAYGFYLVSTVILIFLHAFASPEMAVQSNQAIEAMSKLFTPITVSWGAIVTASFGVNVSNNMTNKA